jgi:hypothetical protein
MATSARSGYHAEEELVLILDDTGGFKYPPALPLRMLYGTMAPHDKMSKVRSLTVN